MKKGDKIIWDSGFGYEVGFFIKDSDFHMFDAYKVKLVTGVVQGVTMREKQEIIPYTKDSYLSMKVKYGYDRFFD